MTKTANPILSLAVVMALAVAAVFGAMSLTGTAEAQVADASGVVICEDAGRIPDQGVALDETETYDVSACFGGVGDSSAGTHVNATYVESSNTKVAVATLEMGEADPSEPTGDVVVEGKALGTADIEITHSGGTKSFSVTIYDSGPVASKDIPDQSVQQGSVVPDDTIEVDLDDYFSGQDITYMVSPEGDTAVDSASVKVDATIDGSTLSLLADDEDVTGNQLITVTATNPKDLAGVMQRFTAYLDAPPDEITIAEVESVTGGDGSEATPYLIMDISVKTGESEEVDLADYFRGSRLVYEVESSDKTAATVTVSEGLVTITGVAIGSADITMEVTRADVTRHLMVDVDVTRGDPVVVPRTVKASLDAGSNDPAKNTRYTFEFNAAMKYIPGVHDIVIEFNEDFTVPGSINESSVTVQVGELSNVTNPSAVLVDGEEITIELGDLNGNGSEGDGSAGVGSIPEGELVTIIFKPSAGISNPSEGGTYGDIKVQDVALAAEFMVIRKVSLSEDDAGRGKLLTATGKGFKDDTSLTFWLDANRNRMKDAGEETLCVDDSISGNVGSCEFVLSNPPFKPGAGKDNDGVNYINAIDGEGNMADADKDKQFKLKPSITVTPEGGNPGQTVLVQLLDFGTNAQVKAATLAGSPICGGTGLPSCGTTLVIPNSAEQGIQRLEVEATVGGKATKNINIGGASVTVNPGMLVANQRVNITGSGFTGNSWIKTITIGSEHFGGFGPTNNNQNVSVDDGGNWSASVIVPIVTSTVTPGERTIRVTDNDGRTGITTVSIPGRTVSINPPSGRVNTLAVVRGENFPGQNDSGASVNVSIVYGSPTPVTISAAPNAGGTFEQQILIPTSAVPGQTYTVRVEFGSGASKSITTTTHTVPAGAIDLSQTSGPSGSTVTVTGEGFRTYVPVNMVSVGGIEVTPAPKPQTNALGNFEFDILIPGLGNGIQTVEVRVGGGSSISTASLGFTVTESGLRGAPTLVAQAVEPLAENLDVVWHFNNDSKEWTFYDGMEGGTLTHMITGETYLILVKSTAEVILNHDTRNLTCANGNCWNQIVW